MDQTRILDAYTATTDATLALWRAHPETGEAEPYRDSTRRLCISSGCKLKATGALHEVHEALLAMAQQDDVFDVTPAAGLHFSFLALSWGLFDEPAEYTNDAAELIALFQQHTAGFNYRITHLRLVPLRNTIILAGVPDAASFEARQAFAEAAMQTKWRPRIEARYQGYEIPPLFWHTTLARYNRTYAPAAMRELYSQFSTRTFDDLELGQPMLALVNYNWTRCFPL